MTKKALSPWLTIGKELLRGAFESVPALRSFERDRRLLKDALLNVAIATEFPIQAVMSEWIAQKKPTLADIPGLASVLDSVLNRPAVRLWLEHWADGPRPVRTH